MQTTRQRLFSIGLLLLGLLWIGLSTDRTGASTNGQIPAPQKGFLAPDFTLETMSGTPYKLSDLRGQVVLINLWASWCLPCRAEMPAIETAYQEYKERGLVVLAVNSTSQDSVASVDAFVAKYGLTFPVLMDYDGTVARLYELTSLPTSFFIGRDGLIHNTIVGGPMSETALRTQVESLLDEDAP